MAGITALLSKRQNACELVRKALDSTFDLQSLQTVIVPLENTCVALGAALPRHLTRHAMYSTASARALLFYGEIYNDMAGSEEASYTLSNYLRQGTDSFSGLNGPCSFLIWDEETKELLAVTDRLGRYPFFYFSAGEVFGITTDLDAVFSSGILRPALLQESLVDFSTIGFPLGTKSLFEGVQRLAGGSVLQAGPDGVEVRRYWQPSFNTGYGQADQLVDTFEMCTRRAVEQYPGCTATLSGGWDSRATWAILGRSGSDVVPSTYGVPKSTDITLAEDVSRELHLAHAVIYPDADFFRSFHDLAAEIIIRGNGHLPIDLAFQLYAYRKLSERFTMMLDSAGCEMRRGIRAQRAAQHGKRDIDLANFLISMYRAGLESVLTGEFLGDTCGDTARRITASFDRLPGVSQTEKIDSFSYHELWSHSYAHGYPMQSGLITVRMPYTDNEFYDQYLAAEPSVRWSHKFQHTVIERFAPELKNIPVAHGGIAIPYGETFAQYAPAAYHLALTTLVRSIHAPSLLAFDNNRPFRPYHRWYGNELRTYVREMLLGGLLREMNIFKMNEIETLIQRQETSALDFSRSLHSLLTLAHLQEYVRNHRLKVL
ncbi:MAG TPA: hypothetical protein VL633_05095 [Bacteroidota bacterium]|nr:hypothetical protein [Bacteroidota bacterium]